MTVVSVDLASCDCRDIGIAVLEGTPERARIRLLAPRELGLEGTPHAPSIVSALIELSAAVGADTILLDGPQGWRASTSAFEHMRLCERCTATPGKTGVPEVVKPSSWTRMARFSVEVFDALHARGWPRFDGSWPVGLRAIESFPTHAWVAMHCDRLPGKGKKPDVTRWMTTLEELAGVRWPRRPTHDEVQAVVAGLAGLALQEAGPSACVIHGRAPFEEGGRWREGFIVSPRRPGAASALAAPDSRPRAGHCFCDAEPHLVPAACDR